MNDTHGTTNGTSGPATGEPFVHVTLVDFLRRGVVTMCGSLEELDRIVGKPSVFCSREHAAILKKDWKTIRGLIERECEAEAAGLTLQQKGFTDVFVWLPKWNSGTAVHELYHAVSMMCDNAGIRDDETGAGGATRLGQEKPCTGNGMRQGHLRGAGLDFAAKRTNRPEHRNRQDAD